MIKLVTLIIGAFFISQNFNSSDTTNYNSKTALNTLCGNFTAFCVARRLLALWRRNNAAFWTHCELPR